MAKYVEFTSDKGTIYINPEQVRVIHGPPSPHKKDQSLVVFDEKHKTNINVPVDQVRAKLERGM